MPVYLPGTKVPKNDPNAVVFTPEQQALRDGSAAMRKIGNQPSVQQPATPTTVPQYQPPGPGTFPGPGENPNDWPAPTTGNGSASTQGTPGPWQAQPSGQQQQQPAPPSVALPGWNQEKWDNPDHQTPKYVWGRIAAAHGDLRDPANREAAVNALLAQFPGATFNGKDKVQIPGFSMPIDIFGNATGGDFTPQWLDLAVEQAAGAGGAAGGAAGAAGASGAAGGAGGAGGGWSSWTSSTTGAPNPNAALYQQRIMELLNTDQTVTPESLAETPEAQAAALTRQRAEERQRGQLMERASVDGYSGGAVEGELAGIRQGLAEHEIGLMADLAGQKMLQNREKLIQGIQFAQADNQFDKAQELSRQLAELDAAIQRQSISAGQSEGAAERALRRELGLLGIGYNYDALGAGLNQQATLALLDGFQ